MGGFVVVGVPGRGRIRVAVPARMARRANRRALLTHGARRRTGVGPRCYLRRCCRAAAHGARFRTV